MTDYTEQDRATMAALALALEQMDNAVPVPFGVGTLKQRVKAWLPACRGLPAEAIAFAADVVCQQFDKYPVPAQFRRLAQGSPAYQAMMEERRLHDPRPPEDPPLCAECGEERTTHYVRLMPQSKSNIAVNVIRHRLGCPRYEDPPHAEWWVEDMGATT